MSYTNAPAPPQTPASSRSFLDHLFLPEDQPRRWGIAESLLLLVWFAVAIYAVHQHAPWADEEQAWMLAGGVSWKTLFTHSLHYEGTGGLWHAFLKVLQALHVSFSTMRWFVVAIQGAAMAVLLRFAPFPRLVRFLLPFTFFLLYQDTVVARSYCLFAILVFPAAVLLRSARPRPLLLAVLLGLMANLSVHGAIASGGLAIAALLLWRGRLMRAIPAVLLLLLLWAGAVATMIPAPDIDYAAGNNIQRSIARIEKQVGLKAPAHGTAAAAPAPANAPEPDRHGLSKGRRRFDRSIAVLTYPLSVFRSLALLLVAALIAQAVLQQRRPLPSVEAELGDAGSLGWIGLVPYGLMVLVFTSLYLAPRHVGMVLTGFVVSAWLTWPSAHALRGRRRPLQLATTGLFALVCLVQITWSFHAIREERRLLYAPGRMTADYLRSQGVGSAGSEKTLAGYYYYSIDPLLYFPTNIYSNQPPHRYWYWSTMMRHYGSVEATLAAHPDFIVLGGYDSGHDAEITRDWEANTPPEPGVTLNDSFFIARYFEDHGYHVTHVFCGHSWMRSTYAELLCNTVLEPVTPGALTALDTVVHTSYHRVRKSYSAKRARSGQSYP